MPVQATTIEGDVSIYAAVFVGAMVINLVVCLCIADVFQREIDECSVGVGAEDSSALWLQESCS